MDGYSGRRVLICPRVFWCIVVLGCTACATLEPEQHPPEPALGPATSEIWTILEEQRTDGWFAVLNSGEDGLRWRVRAIRAATSSLDIQTFLWKPDASGRLLLDELIRAADRGVRVRVLLDDSFTVHETHPLRDLDAHDNVELRIYNPFRVRPDSAVLRELFSLGEFSRVNRRMHNKVLITDGRVAVVGGRNVADEYFGMHADFNFRDMDVLTAGAHVAEAAREFARANGVIQDAWLEVLADDLAAGEFPVQDGRQTRILQRRDRIDATSVKHMPRYIAAHQLRDSLLLGNGKLLEPLVQRLFLRMEKRIITIRAIRKT